MLIFVLIFFCQVVWNWPVYFTNPVLNRPKKNGNSPLERMHAQAIARDEGKSDRQKGGVELVTNEGNDVTKVKLEGVPNRGGARPGDLAM